MNTTNQNQQETLETTTAIDIVSLMNRIKAVDSGEGSNSIGQINEEVLIQIASLLVEKLPEIRKRLNALNGYNSAKNRETAERISEAIAAISSLSRLEIGKVIEEWTGKQVQDIEGKKASAYERNIREEIAKKQKGAKPGQNASPNPDPLKILGPSGIRKCKVWSELNPGNNRNDYAWQILMKMEQVFQNSKTIIRDDHSHSYGLSELLEKDPALMHELDEYLQDKLGGRRDLMKEINANLCRLGLSKDSAEGISICAWKKDRRDEIPDILKGLSAGGELRPETASMIGDYIRAELPAIDRNIEMGLRIKLLPDAMKAVFENPYLKTIEHGRIRELIKISINILLDPSYKSVISLAYGGTRDSANLRSPSYIVAATHTLEKLMDVEAKLNEKGLKMNLPQIRVFSAHNAAHVVNHIEWDKLCHNAKQNIALLQAYLKEYHPGLMKERHGKKSVVFTEYPLETWHALKDELDLMVKMLDANKDNPVREKLEKMGHNHGGEEGLRQVASYIAVHPLYLLDLLPTDPAKQRQVLGEIDYIPDGTISYGGEPEELFNFYRRYLQDEYIRTHGKNGKPATNGLRPVPTAHCISRSGRYPVYYKHKRGDISVDDLKQGQRPDWSEIEGGKLSHDVINDLKIILEDIKTATSNNGGAKASAKDLWNKYLQFLNKHLQTCQQPSIQISE